MKRLCAWCGKELGEKPGGEPDDVTHGICKKCMEKLLASTNK